MDSYKVNITKQAEESMRDIALYIARNIMNVSAYCPEYYECIGGRGTCRSIPERD